MHTKGPWKQGLDFFGKPCNRIEDAEGNPIAYADWHPDGIRDWGKTIANARLIAQAPAMWQACNDALFVIQNDSYAKSPEVIETLKDILIEAIRPIKGE